MKINLILAADINGGIGKNNLIPWKIKEDMLYFKNVTLNNLNNAVIMGRKTWESIPSKFKPLNNRTNIIISKSLTNDNNNLYHICSNIEEALDYCKKNKINTSWIIGGEKVYKYFLENNNFDFIYLTKIYDNYDCDTHIKNINSYIDELTLVGNSNVQIESNYRFQYFIYGNKNAIQISNLDKIYFPKEVKFNIHPDITYLKLLLNVLENGERRETRNSDTISTFGNKIEFDLKSGFPLLTSKKIYWKGVLHELLWFIKGDTNSKNLEKEKVNIWKKNTELSFLQKSNLNYPDGEGGPIYGWQWRRFNQSYEYKDSKTDKYSKTAGFEKGFDQLQYIIDEIRSNPNSRRLFMSAWNPSQMDQMCLPPCHVSYQFYVNKNGLSCQMYQRSADLFLGLPFNIASTAALTSLIAHHCNIEVDKLSICIGDTHIYSDHLEAIKKQLYLNKPIYNLPKLILKNRYENIDDYSFDDFSLNNYESNETIKAQMIA